MSWSPERRREYEESPERKERKRVRIREWRAANPELSRERSREYARQWRAANRERARELDRRRSPEQRERRREYDREWLAANPERRREYEQRRSRDPKRREQTRAARTRSRHGKNFDADYAAMWQAQDGCCYLCEQPLIQEKAVVDHDHTCCPDRRSCSLCRRGLACTLCNVLIGAAHDDPQLLRTIADNLEPVLNATRARIAASPRQETLGYYGDEPG